MLIVDNPVVSTLADAGILNTTEDLRLDTSSSSRTCWPPARLDGKTYGVPIGANTLALYYNKAVLKAAGVDIASVKDWASLTAALAKVKAAGKKGITFSAIGTEEGSFQFLPWFWGSGAKLTELDSAEGRLGAAAVDRLAQGGLRAELRHQQHPDHQLAGVHHRRLRLRRERHLAAGRREEVRLSTTGAADPAAKAGGVAPAPTGGEFVTVPVQQDTALDAPPPSSSSACPPRPTH